MLPRFWAMRWIAMFQQCYTGPRTALFTEFSPRLGMLPQPHHYVSGLRGVVTIACTRCDRRGRYHSPPGRAPWRRHDDELLALLSADCPQVIPNPRLCKALIDRLTDQAHIIETGSESHRLSRT